MPLYITTHEVVGVWVSRYMHKQSKMLAGKQSRGQTYIPTDKYRQIADGLVDPEGQIDMKSDENMRQ